MARLRAEGFATGGAKGLIDAITGRGKTSNPGAPAADQPTANPQAPTAPQVKDTVQSIFDVFKKPKK
jgi:hypothetical protein